MICNPYPLHSSKLVIKSPETAIETKVLNLKNISLLNGAHTYFKTLSLLYFTTIYMNNKLNPYVIFIDRASP